MRKIKKRALILLLSITPVIFYMIFSSRTIEAIDKPIMLIPDARLFEVANMKPGDTITKIQTIHNQSEGPFSYIITTEKESGSDLLYNQLDLKVIVGNSELYNGKLKFLKLADPLKLGKNSQQEITLQFHFPIESGNEYQGLITSVAFIYTAEEDQSNPPDDGDPPDLPGEEDNTDPPTGTNEPPSNNPTPTKSGEPPAKGSGSLPQTGEDNPIWIILSGLFISMAGLALLLIKKSIISNPFKRG